MAGKKKGWQPEPGTVVPLEDAPDPVTFVPMLIDLAKLPHIPLRLFVTVEGVAGVTGQNTRTITRGGPGMQGLEIDLLPTIAHIWVRLPPIPGQPSTKLRERLVPCANVSASEPLR